MAFSDDLLALAKEHVGEDYILGSRCKFLDPEFAGPWDCAEFVSWVIFRASNEAILLGTRPRNPEHGDAYTGYWSEDAEKYGLVVSVAEAVDSKGHLLLRRPTSSLGGHIAFSRGDGKSTIEAHSKKEGVIIGKADPDKRGWHLGVRVPTPSQWSDLATKKSNAANWSLVASTNPLRDPRVPTIAAAMNRAGYRLPASTAAYSEKVALKVARFQAEKGIVVDGVAGPQTAAALGINWAKDGPGGTFNDKYNVFFASLVSGGFYSSDPDDLKTRRSIRTNNPGALNISEWQKALPGYVGFTAADNSPNKNRTTIYRTPEHGVAAWYVLLADRYGFAKAGKFTLKRLAQKYAGSGASEVDVNAYVKGWTKASGGKLDADSSFDFDRTGQLLVLARAMFFHEIGKPSPLKDAQIEFGIETQRDGKMPD